MATRHIDPDTKPAESFDHSPKPEDLESEEAAPESAKAPKAKKSKRSKAKGKKSPKAKSPSKETTKRAKKVKAPKAKTPKAKKPKALKKPGPGVRGVRKDGKPRRAARTNPPQSPAALKAGLKVAKGRQAKGLTQKALATKCGISQPGLANIERGVAPASEKLQAKLLKAVGA